MKIVLVTGGFDPLHRGHLAYFNAAKALGDRLVVGVNSDNWLTRKKGKPFIKFGDRWELVANLKSVDLVLPKFDDSDDSSNAAIIMVKEIYPNSPIIFANGGDRTPDNIPEMEFHRDVQFVFGVGGLTKLNSSSALLANWNG